LTVVGGRVVYAKNEYAKLGPADLPVSPSWSPVKQYGGYFDPGKKSQREASAMARNKTALSTCTHSHDVWTGLRVFGKSGLWNLSCDCFAF
jgi:hypothetical protein